MKTLTVLFLAIAVSFATLNAQTVDINKSTLQWEGKKVTGKHDGYIKLKSAELKLEGSQLVSGEFIIDMASMTNSDIENEGMRNKLMGHLKSDDFFGVETYPTAKLVISEASKFINNEAEVKGKLTIKGITHPIAFKTTKKGSTLNAKITVDRSKFNVRYGSGKFFSNLGDKTIYDDFTLDVKLHLN